MACEQKGLGIKIKNAAEAPAGSTSSLAPRPTTEEPTEAHRRVRAGTSSPEAPLHRRRQGP